MVNITDLSSGKSRHIYSVTCFVRPLQIVWKNDGIFGQDMFKYYYVRTIVISSGNAEIEIEQNYFVYLTFKGRWPYNAVLLQ